MRRSPWLCGVALGLLAGCGDSGPAPDSGALDAGAPTDAASLDGGDRDGSATPDSGAPDAPPVTDSGGHDAGPPPCSLDPSGPVRVTTDDAVVENLSIDADGEPAVRVEGASGVTLRNLHITHRGAAGIDVRNSDDVTIESVVVEYLGSPDSGPNPSADHVNIYELSSARATIQRALLRRGSSGIYLVRSPGSHLSFIEGEDFRGPFPRGQVVQWDNSDDGLLEDFSVVNPPESWPEDNVNVYQSTGMTIRRGHIDGNNSPSGVGVIFDGGDATGRVEDVDAIHMGNGCFSAYAGGDGSVFLRTRCRDNICEDQGRGLPSSNALMWAGQPGLSALRIEDSAYFAACNPGNIVWPRDSFAVIELREEDFTPRGPLALRFCWE